MDCVLTAKVKMLQLHVWCDRCLTSAASEFQMIAAVDGSESFATLGEPFIHCLRCDV